MKHHGLKGSEAERLLQKWLEADKWTVHRAARAGFIRLPNGKGFCRSHDIYGCIDLLAIKRYEPNLQFETWALQVCTAGGRSERRRKIEGIRWPLTWRVTLASHETTQDPADRRRVRGFWRFEDYQGDSKWSCPVAVAV